MSVVEVQYRQSVFFNMIRRNINLRTPPVGEVFGNLVEGWECTSVALATASQTSGLGPDLPGTLRVAASVTIYLTSYNAAKTAGSGVKPQTTPLVVTLIIRFSGGPGNQLTIEIESGEALGTDISALVQGQTFDPIAFGADAGIIVARTWIGVGSDVIAIRLATNVGDGVNTPVIIRIPEGADWAQHVAPGVIAQQVLAVLVEEITKIPDTEIEEEPSWHWMPIASGFTGWGLYLYVGIEKIDGCGDVDMSVDIYAGITFASDFTQTPPQRRQRMHVRWDVSDWDSFKCGLQFGFAAFALGPIFGAVGAVIGAAIGGAIIGIVGMVIAGEVSGELGGTEEVDDMVKIGGGEDDGYVLYEGSGALVAPDAGGIDASVQGFVAVADGLLTWGAATVTQPSPWVSHYAQNPWWPESFDCDTNTWSTNFSPPVLIIQDFARPLIVYEVKAAPEDRWNVSEQSLGTFRFLPKPIIPEAGTALEVFAHSSAGVRWFEFLPIPPEPKPPAPEKLLQYKVECQLNSLKQWPKDWPLGIFNPKWHIDPPPEADIRMGMGRELIREWRLVIKDLQAGSVVQVFAVTEGTVDPRNFDPRFAWSKAILYADSHGFASVRVATRTNQELVVQADTTAEHLPSLRIGRRWLVPQHRVEFKNGLEAIVRVSSGIAVATAGTIHLIERSGRIGPALVLRAVERYAMSGRSYRGLHPEKLGRLVAAARHAKDAGYSPGMMAIDEAAGNVYVIDGNSLVACLPTA
jgi:hypothetical protein